MEKLSNYHYYYWIITQYMANEATYKRVDLKYFLRKKHFTLEINLDLLKDKHNKMFIKNRLPTPHFLRFSFRG